MTEVFEERELTNSSEITFDDYSDDETTDSMWLERVLTDSGSGVDQPAAIIVETVQGEGGLSAARASWLRSLSTLCQEYGTLLVVDDVQAGYGRTGTFFSSEETGITPDIVCLSKSISGSGMPLALTLSRPELGIWSPGPHDGTFRGRTPSFVTATAALEYFWADATFQVTVSSRIEQMHARPAGIVEATEDAAIRGRGACWPASPSTTSPPRGRSPPRRSTRACWWRPRPLHRSARTQIRTRHHLFSRSCPCL